MWHRWHAWAEVADTGGLGPLECPRTPQSVSGYLADPRRTVPAWALRMVSAERRFSPGLWADAAGRDVRHAA